MPKSIAILLIGGLAMVGGCSSQPMRDIGLDKLALRPAEKNLSQGIRDYEEGDYKAATQNLYSALAGGLTFKSDTVTAHKYLAFIHCASEREKQCREEFRKAFEIDPNFELKKTESGHPLWTPVYQDVRAEFKKRK